MRARVCVILGLLTLSLATATALTRAQQAAGQGAQTKGQGAQGAAAAQATPPAPTPSREEIVAAAYAARDARRALGAQLYAKYCVQCHGTKGEGHIADHANSLRSQSFLSTVSSQFLDNAIRYGRSGTAMAAYHQSFGGPLTDQDLVGLVEFIRTLAEVKRVNPGKDRPGDTARGKQVYHARCENCHGPEGKGPLAPSLNDPLFHLTVSGPYLRYAIAEGRDGTPMPAFKDTLSEQEIDDVTAHLLSWSRQWTKPGAVRLKPTSLSEAVLNPNGSAADLGPLGDDLFVTVPALKQALDGGSRIILLDVRVPSAWAIGHIPGAVPLPYSEAEQKASLLTNDGTWIVAYCECPTALSKRVVNTLRGKGFKNTAVLDEGLAGWVARKFPLASGIVDEATP